MPEADVPALSPNALQDELLDAIGEAVIATEPDGTILYWNRAAEEMYGWSQEEVLGEDLLELAPSQAIVADLDTINAKLEDGETWRGTIDIQHKDGSTVVADVIDAPVLRDGELVAIVGVLRDVTERERLRNRLEDAQGLAGLGIWTYDTDTGETWWSDELKRIFGIPEDEEGSLERFVERLHPEDRERFPATPGEVDEEPGIREDDYRIVLPDGEVRWVQSRIRVEAEPLTPGAVLHGTALDVTERVELEQDIRQRQRLLEETQKVAGVGSWEWIPGEDRLTMSDEKYRLLGLEPEDLVDPSLEDFLARVHPEDRSRLEAAAQQIVDDPSQAPLKVEYRALRPDGTERWLETLVEADLEDGQLVRTYGKTLDIHEDKVRERKLEEQKALVDEIEAFAGLGYWEWDIREDVSTWSENHYRMLGYEPGEVEPGVEPFMDRVHPDDRAELQALLDEVLEDPPDEAQRTEYRIQHPDGTTIWAETRHRVETEDGEPVRMLGKTMDITEQKRLQDEIREHGRRLEEAQRVARVGSWAMDVETGELTWSDEQYRLFGYEPGDPPTPTMEHVYARVPLEDTETIEEAVETALEAHEFPNFEFQVVHPDETELWLEARGEVETEDGEAVRLIGTVLDVTERKDHEAELERQKTLVDEIEAFAGLAYWEWNVAEGTFSWSDNHYRLLGYEPSEVEPRIERFLERVHPDDREQFQGVLDEVLEDPPDEAQRTEYRIQRPDGTTIWAEIRYRVRTEDGEPVSILGKTLNVTERKEAEQKLETKIRALEKRDQQLSRLQMASSHPLREAVRDVRLHLQHLEASAKDRLTEEERQELEATMKTSNHLHELMEGVREYVELAANVPEPAEIDLGATLDGVIQELSDLIEATGATVTRGDLPVVHAQDDDLHVALRHLVENGIVYNEGTPHVHVDAEADDDVWVLTVEDDGIGIDPKYHERIFQPFTQLHARAELEGAGLGLSVARWLVEDMGGTVWVTSQEGEGATFHATLPRERGSG